MGLGTVVVLLLLILLFFAPPLWVRASGPIMAAVLLTSVAVWRNPISEEKLAAARREVALYQTRSGDYAPLSGDEQRALLLIRIA